MIKVCCVCKRVLSSDGFCLDVESNEKLVSHGYCKRCKLVTAIDWGLEKIDIAPLTIERVQLVGKE